MSEQARCEPPEGLRDQDGTHYVVGPDDGVSEWWWSDGWRNFFGDVSVEGATRTGHRYLMPVPSPADLTALVLAGRRHLESVYDAMWDRPPDMSELSAALDAFSHIQEPSP